MKEEKAEVLVNLEIGKNISKLCGATVHVGLLFCQLICRLALSSKIVLIYRGCSHFSNHFCIVKNVANDYLVM